MMAGNRCRVSFKDADRIVHSVEVQVPPRGRHIPRVAARWGQVIGAFVGMKPAPKKTRAQRSKADERLRVHATTRCDGADDH
jgi:hypothetical protein